ncbi:hypothetical protein A2U01_0079612, partial [Trifolium medium]|nr:hypothetical protein [Trifolium medium]
RVSIVENMSFVCCSSEARLRWFGMWFPDAF